MTNLVIGGLTPLTTIDFPGRLSAVVFCQGCPWRCGYCHNPELLPRRSDTRLHWDNVMSFLERRQGLLDAVVFSGGEPTMHEGLFDALLDVKKMGFQVGLHTAGPYPSRLARLLPSLDWVGMDIKAPFGQYEKVTGIPGSGTKALESTKLILKSGVSCEFRTTLHPYLMEADTLPQLARSLAALGVHQYVLQEQRSLGARETQIEISNALVARVEPSFEQFNVRRCA